MSLQRLKGLAVGGEPAVAGQVSVGRSGTWSSMGVVRASVGRTLKCRGYAPMHYIGVCETKGYRELQQGSPLLNGE